MHQLMSSLRMFSYLLEWRLARTTILCVVDTVLVRADQQLAVDALQVGGNRLVELDARTIGFHLETRSAAFQILWSYRKRRGRPDSPPGPSSQTGLLCIGRSRRRKRTNRSRLMRVGCRAIPQPWSTYSLVCKDKWWRQRRWTSLRWKEVRLGKNDILNLINVELVQMAQSYGLQKIVMSRSWIEAGESFVWQIPLIKACFPDLGQPTIRIFDEVDMVIENWAE